MILPPHPSSSKQTLSGRYFAENTKIFEVQWFWHNACGQSNSWAWIHFTLVHPGSDMQWYNWGGSHDNLTLCKVLCVCSTNLCFYAFVCLCVDGCMNMSVCVCICVFVCIDTYKYICVTHRCKDAVLAPCTGKAMCHRTVSCPAAAAARGVTNAILNYL